MKHQNQLNALYTILYAREYLINVSVSSGFVVTFESSAEFQYISFAITLNIFH